MCCPENFVQKTKSCSLVTQKGEHKSTKKKFVPFVVLSPFLLEKRCYAVTPSGKSIPLSR